MQERARPELHSIWVNVEVQGDRVDRILGPPFSEQTLLVRLHGRSTNFPAIALTEEAAVVTMSPECSSRRNKSHYLSSLSVTGGSFTVSYKAYSNESQLSSDSCFKRRSTCTMSFHSPQKTRSHQDARSRSRCRQEASSLSPRSTRRGIWRAC